MSLFLEDPTCVVFSSHPPFGLSLCSNQTSTPPSTRAISVGKPFTVVNPTATAEWATGSPQESGTTQLQAKVDGSTNVQLSLA
jgi:hypothetical protein